MLGAKTVSIHVEIVDATLDYNLLLGRNWFYAMTVVGSSVFRTVQFPHLGQIVTIDQLSFYHPDTSNSDANSVPVIGHSKPHYEDIGVGLLKDSTINGVFPEVPCPHNTVNMIASTGSWLASSSSTEEITGDRMPLSPHEKWYESIQALSDTLEQRDHHVAADAYSLPCWLNEHDRSSDYLSLNLPSDESIMEAMSVDDLPWNDDHHRSSFLPDIQDVEDRLTSLVPPEITLSPETPILTHHVLSEGNLANITETRPIDISVKPGIVENVHIGVTSTPEEVTSHTALFKEFRDIFAWSYEEMPGIDPSIIVHEIKTYPDV